MEATYSILTSFFHTIHPHPHTSWPCSQATASLGLLQLEWPPPFCRLNREPSLCSFAKNNLPSYPYNDTKIVHLSVLFWNGYLINWRFYTSECIYMYVLGWLFLWKLKKFKHSSTCNFGQVCNEKHNTVIWSYTTFCTQKLNGVHFPLSLFLLSGT